MSEKDNSVPLLPFEIERQDRIKGSLVIRVCAHNILHTLAEWLRIIVLRSTQLARRPTAKRRICSDIRELQQLDDRMLADIGVIRERAQFDGQIAAVNAQILSRAGLLSIVAFRLCAAASTCLAAAGATAAESATVVSPICAAADLRLTTLIEAHGRDTRMARATSSAPAPSCTNDANAVSSAWSLLAWQ